MPPPPRPPRPGPGGRGRIATAAPAAAAGTLCRRSPGGWLRGRRLLREGNRRGSREQDRGAEDQPLESHGFTRLRNRLQKCLLPRRAARPALVRLARDLVAATADEKVEIGPGVGL